MKKIFLSLFIFANFSLNFAMSIEQTKVTEQPETSKRFHLGVIIAVLTDINLYENNPEKMSQIEDLSDYITQESLDSQFPELIELALEIYQRQQQENKYSVTNFLKEVAQTFLKIPPELTCNDDAYFLPVKKEDFYLLLKIIHREIDEIYESNAHLQHS